MNSDTGTQSSCRKLRSLPSDGQTAPYSACCSDRSHHAASDSCTAETRDRQASLSSKLWFSKGLSGFPDDFPGLFVVSQHNELRVTKMVCVCPFQKVDAGYGLWSKPHAFLHLLRR